MEYDTDGFGQQKYSICPNCRSALVHKNGKFGGFYGCIRFPKCKFTCQEDQYVPPGESAVQPRLWVLVHTQCDYPNIITRPRVFSHKARAKAALKSEVAAYAKLHEYNTALDMKIAEDGCSAESDDGLLHWSLHECWVNTDTLQEETQ